MIDARNQVVCFDSYPNFGKVVTDADSEDTREDYVTNLRIVRTVAAKAKLPMWLYFNIVPYGGSGVKMPKEGHSDPTEAQVSQTHCRTVIFIVVYVPNQST